MEVEDITAGLTEELQGFSAKIEEWAARADGSLAKAKDTHAATMAAAQGLHPSHPVASPSPAFFDAALML